MPANLLCELNGHLMPLLLLLLKGWIKQTYKKPCIKSQQTAISDVHQHSSPLEPPSLHLRSQSLSLQPVSLAIHYAVAARCIYASNRTP